MIFLFRAYRYRIYPDQEQQVLLSKMFGCVRFVYNHYLAEQIRRYEAGEKYLSKTDCNNDLNRSLKDEYPWLREADKFALTNAVYHLDCAYQNLFKRGVGFPRFKSKHDHHDSYTTNFTNGNIKADFEKNQLQLPKLKKVTAKLHRTFSGSIKSATISRTPSGKYYVALLAEEEAIETYPAADKAIGIDVGIKEFLVDSDGNHIENPKYLRQNERKLAKEQRKLSHKTKGSHNWEKQRIKVARQHEKIHNSRENHAHQLSAQIVRENQTIISEDLRIGNMLRNRHLSKAIADVSWGGFYQKLEYKAKWYGRTYHRISPWYASSQICSTCGEKNGQVKVLSVREWECSCGAKHHRDENAAKNILRKGMEELRIA